MDHGEYYICFLITGWNSRRFSIQLRDFLAFCRENIGKRGKYCNWQESEHNWFFVTGTFGYRNGQIMGWEWKFLFRNKSDVAKILIQYGGNIKYQTIGTPSLLAGTQVK